MAGLRASALTGRVSDFERVCVHELFQRRAGQTPGAVAMRFGTREVSYADLDSEANRVAHALREHGVGRETLVGILLDRSPELVVAILATLKAGGTYVPLDPHFPPARLRQILADCRPPVVLTSERLRDHGGSIPTIALDAGETILTSQPTTCPEQVNDAFASSIYVIYTSGSTGRPKGIVQLHEALSNLTQWQLRETEIDFAGNVLQLSSPGFDVHLQEIFGTLAAGGTICLLEHADVVDPRRLIARAAEHEITTMFVSVSTLTRMFATDSRLASLPESLSDLVTAGEQLYLNDALAAWLQRRPHVRLHNHYGVSESHVVTSSTFAARDGALPAKPPIGRAISNVRLALLDAHRRSVPDGEPGEIWIAGPCLARHYLNDPAKTALHWFEDEGERWYRTGDLARMGESEEIEFVGRLDDQVKIRGHLVEPGDVEAALRSLPSISECVVAPRTSAAGEVSLVGWYTPATPIDEVRGELAELLPGFMVPSALVPLERLPIGATGKVDRSRLPPPSAGRSSLGTTYRPASSEAERMIAAAIAALLDVESIGVDDNFFDLGADSLTLATAAETIAERLNRPVEVLRMYETPTVRTLAAALSGRQAPAPPGSSRRARPARTGRGYEPIAIVGMAGRFPSCDSVDELWRSLLAGRECLEDIEESERERSPVLPTEDSLDRVRHLGLLRDADMFDSGFFGIPHGEAVWTDPQHRVFLECAWAALEDAGCVPAALPRIGVFAGAEVNTYLMHLQPRLHSMADYLRALVATDKDFLATRAAYRLGLEGPAMTVQTACSTSLVAVHMACRSLADGECDGALAGGVSIQLPQRAGHLAPEGLIYSPDGRTRPFDRRADGTNMTNGVALVVLKRLEDATRDRDHVHAVIVGSAVNNDGARKVGYVAPSVRGQAEVVADAFDAAGATADTIDFIEAHGTATPIGDAIELAALTEVFRRDTSSVGCCALGSIKGNIGHLNRAAGVTGLIKAALAIEHGTLPPTWGHEEPNPDLRLDRSPFFVVTEPHPLRERGPLRRAGVSSFGIGGTNAHVVLEQAPAVMREPAAPLPRALTLSARSPGALRTRARQLAERLQRDPPARIDDVALTLNAGRAALPHRRSFVAASPEEAVAAAREMADLLPDAGITAADRPKLAFVFPGQGAQRAGSGRDAYRTHPVFRAAFDEFAGHVAEVAAVDIRRFVTGELSECEARELLASSLHAQCLLVGLSRATAMLLMDWGVRPSVVLGHSTGEYAAACVAGSLSPADCALLVATRGRLMDELAPRGAMVSVALPLEQARRYEGNGVWMAAANARGITVLAGEVRQMERVERRLERDGVQARRLSNRNPNHTPLMGAMADPLAAAAESVTMRSPAPALMAGATGEWVEGTEIDAVAHWVQHLCRPVLFSKALDALLDHGAQAIIETGPGRTLLALAAGQVQADVGLHATLGGEADGELRQLAATLGSLWQAGADVDWSRFHHGDVAVKMPLPTYPFERRRAWVAPPGAAGVPAAAPPVRDPDPARWLYVREWSRTRLPIRCEGKDLASGAGGEPWLVVGDGGGLGAAVARLLRDGGATVKVATASSTHAGAAFDLAAGDPADFDRLARHLRSTGARPARIVHVAAAGPDAIDPLLSLARLLTSCRGLCADSLEVWVATRAGIAAAAGEKAQPDRAGVAALRIVTSQEDPTVTCRQVDLDAGGTDDDGDARVLLDEIVHGGELEVVAYRRGRRLEQRFRPLPAPRAGAACPPHGGHHLVTGGLGNVGAAVARWLLLERGARLSILGRTPLGEGQDSPPSGARGRGGTSAVRAERLRALRALGEVRYEAADVADERTMASAIARAERAFGPLTGVFHLAAAIDGHRFLRLIGEVDEESLRAQIEPKVRGIEVLDRLLAHRPLDVRVAFSSIATTLGGTGYSVYASSNMALAAAALAARSPWQVIDWDVWEVQDDLDPVPLGSAAADLRMPVPDALRCLELALAARSEHLVVSTADLGARIAHTRSRLARVEESDAEDPGDSPLDRADPRALERAAAAAWCRALGVERVVRDSSFVALGGDSLLAIRVVLDLGERLGTRLAASTMLTAPTFGDFLDRLTETLEGASPGPAPPPPQPAEMRLIPSSRPASALEERWFEMERRGFGYLDLPLVIHGDVDDRRMLDAIGLVFERNPVLRGVYERDEDGSLIQTARPWRPHVDVLDLRPLPAAELVEAVRRAASELASGRFDLEREPPFRMRILRIGEQRRLLLAATHHIVLDGWSASLFADTLTSAYPEQSHGPTAQRHYGEFAAWQRRFLQGPEVEPVRDFWREHFRDGPPPTRLPRDGSGDPSDLTGRRVTRMLDPARAARLRGLAREEGVTLFPLFLRAFARMLGDVTGEAEVVFGTTVAGRHTPGSAEMLGVFVNPLPVRIAVGETGPTLAAAADLLAALQDHQSYVLADLVRHVEPFAGLDINETFHNYVLFQNFPRPVASDPDLRVEVLETDGSIEDPLLAVLEREKTTLMREHELVIHRLADGGLLLSFWYRQSLFERATVSAWADRYMAALQASTVDRSAPERLALGRSR